MGVTVGLIMRTADALSLPLAVAHAVIDSHEASEADVRHALQEVEDRVVGARREPHPLQLLAEFEQALPSWEPSEAVER